MIMFILELKISLNQHFVWCFKYFVPQEEYLSDCGAKSNFEIQELIILKDIKIYSLRDIVLNVFGNVDISKYSQSQTLELILVIIPQLLPLLK